MRKRKTGNGVSLVEAEGKAKTAGAQTPEAPTAKNNYSPIPSTISRGDAPASYSKTALDIQKLNEPSWGKFENIRKLKEELDAKRAKSKSR